MSSFVPAFVLKVASLTLLYLYAHRYILVTGEDLFCFKMDFENALDLDFYDYPQLPFSKSMLKQELQAL